MVRLDDNLAPWQRLGPKFKLGLRARDEQTWLPHEDAFGDVDRRAAQIRLANHLLDSKRAEVFATTDANLHAAREVLVMVIDNLKHHHPGDLPQPLDNIHPLEAAARILPEDLLLLNPRNRDNADEPLPEWVLVAAALRFPAHWRLADKMGRALAAIHEPVPHYSEILERPMDRFFSNMQTGPISHRWNWSVVTSPELFTPDRALSDPLAVGDGIQRLFVRMESQTLRKLPESGQILFTIRTYIEPVLKWAHIPGALADLVTMLAGMSPKTRAYKGVTRYEDALRHHLANLQS